MSRTHKNAILSPAGRKAMVESVLYDGVTLVSAGKRFNVTPQTVRKCKERYEEEGEAGLEIRSSCPHNRPSATPPDVVEKIIELRKTNLTGDHIARIVDIPRRTVSDIISRAGLSRQKDIKLPEDPPKRYEHENPRDMIHLDIKKGNYLLVDTWC